MKMGGIISSVVVYLDEKEGMFYIPSSSRHEDHTVAWDHQAGWFCTCEHYQFNKAFCKHMQEAYELSGEKGRKLGKKVFRGLGED